MEIWGALIPILLADILNPVLFAFLVYAAGTDRPVANSSAMLLGHTAAYLIAGIVLSYALESIAERLTNPRQIDFFIELVVGVALLWLALKSRNVDTKNPQNSQPRLNMVTAFGFGIVINFIGIPFAVPYFAAIAQILKSDPAFLEALFLLIAYNILYALPFAIVPALVAVMGSRAQPVLQRISSAVDRISGFLMPIILALVGLALLADAIAYFATGAPLF